MSKKPASMPVFGDAYLADTTHLTTEEHGAYWLLLLAAWRQEDCSLPNDDRKLARIAGLTPRKWKSIKPTILEFWTVSGETLAPAFTSHFRRERAALPLAVRRAVVERDGDRCRYCGDTAGPFQFDHVLPWSRGGLDTIENIVRSCIPCNREKADRTPEEMGWTL